MSEVQWQDSLVLLRLSGRLDGRAAQQVQRKCDEVRKQGIRSLALELGQVTFLASSGLGVFLAETEEFKEIGGSLHLVGISGVVASVVNLLNVGRFLSIVATEEELPEAMQTR
jgi:stage II sporulation protein AA (anti-sigma F factor antagonist)